MGTMKFSDAVDAIGRELVVFLPTVADPLAVTVTEAKAAATVHLTCNIRGFNATMEQTKTKRYRLCGKQGFDRLGRTDWSIERLTFIDDPQAEDDNPEYPHKSIVPGTRGYILRRRGIEADPADYVDFAADQLYQLFPVQFGERQDVPVAPEEDGQEFEYLQEIAVTGTVVRGKLAAGA
ncbi:hypothetical protein GCM10009616_35750 [Microlunatus lacustris]